MLSRWFAILLGFLLLLLGVGAMLASSAAGVSAATLISVGIIWIITAIVAFWYGFGVREGEGTRWFSGIVGSLFLIWGIVTLFIAAVQQSAIWLTLGLFLLVLGALGLAAALWRGNQELVPVRTRI
jgi:uncharacterized membrane protein HdeD (DUF308 family)